MTINVRFKNLIVIALLSGMSSFTAQSAEDDKSLAPEATAAEAKLSFWDMPLLKKAYIDSSPTDRKDGIAVGELGVDGGNKDKIIQLTQEIADSKHGDYDSLLIAQNGKLLFESYFKRARINLPHPQASATKVYTSLALGRAIQLGYLSMADLDRPVVSFLKDLDPAKFVAGAEKVTLHQAMTMRSGIRVSRDQRTKFRENPSQLEGQGHVQTYLEQSAPITKETQSFLYQGFDTVLVMQVLDAVVPGTAKDFIKKELLDKMGITTYGWQTDVSGLPGASSGSSMTSRNMIKWGTLALNKGKWQGEQLISAEYLAKATSGITKAAASWHPKDFFYGYFWYQTKLTVGDKSYDTNIVWGGGGQRIVAIEELDLIVVITGDDRVDTIMAQVSSTILPAFAK
ncbi:MAG: hydrolase [Kordiimonadales bacterium]|nr:MAG: hydrolase [Kordiimonadales bacterium]